MVQRIFRNACWLYCIWPISVDRVTPGSVKAENVHFRDYPENSSPELYFNNIIGVTRNYNETTAKDFMVADREYEIRIGLHSFRAWMYLVTNPIHHSQTIVQDFDSNQDYGSVSIRVIPNIEMYQTILGLGKDVYMGVLKNPKNIEKYLHSYKENFGYCFHYER